MTSKRANFDEDTGDEKQNLSPSGLPIHKIPGGYGVPFFSPVRDRLDYYYFQGAEEFFRSRIKCHGGATVLRLNMPPGPFLSGDSHVVAFLDARSFRVLFDDASVDKADTLDGTYMPSLTLFGGHRPLAFLDVANPRHATLKRIVIQLVATRMHHVAPAFSAAFTAMFNAVEAGLVASGPVEFNKLNAVHMLDFICTALFGGTPPSKAMGATAATKALKWLTFQIHPLMSKVIKPWPLEDLLFHTFRLPPFLMRHDYAKLTAYFTDITAATLDDAEKVLQGTIPRDELLHNLVFLAIFNAYAGFKVFLPHLVKWLTRGGAELHARLAEEVRASVLEACTGEAITLTTVEKMPLVKSVVWEALRMNPPVEFQYGRARRDMVVESHDAAYEVRKGEMLFGYQPLATRDERVFHHGREFVSDRFMFAAGKGSDKQLLEHVVWSNGPETREPTEGNKQCPGKDMVVAVGRLMVAELFRRYDTFTAIIQEMPVEPVVTFTSLTRAAAGHGSANSSSP
ncbi:hypothetical protein ACP70R_022140 [Stipagrostis hirtigluma subsp. patula]